MTTKAALQAMEMPTLKLVDCAIESGDGSSAAAKVDEAPGSRAVGVGEASDTGGGKHLPNGVWQPASQ